MKGNNSLTQINARVEREQAEYDKACIRRDGTINGHWKALLTARTDQLRAENEVRA